MRSLRLPMNCPTIRQESAGCAPARTGARRIFRRYKNESLEAQEQLLRHLRIIVDGLNHLPVPPSFERLSLFAQRISGDPHFLDVQTATGRLFLHALMDLARLEHPAYAN